MAAPADNREQLREYLRCLSSEKQAELLTSIERAVLRGEEVADVDLILTELRRIIRNSLVKAERAGSPSRLFFDPITPFLVDGGPHSVVRGQISRNSLNPIWIWISRDLLPREAKSYSDAVNRALGAEEHANALAHVESFHEIALARIRNALASQENKNRVRDRLAMYMGQPRAMADLHEIVTVLTIRHPLAAVASKLPQHIEALCGDDLATAIRSLDEAGPLPGDALIYALLIVMRRLTEPWQLVRIAAAAATRKSGAANAPYRLAIMLVVAEMEDLLAQLRAALKADETAEIAR